MFERLLGLLARPDTAPLHAADARLALAALMVRLARSDSDYAAVERATIEAALAKHHGLDATAARSLLAEAEALEAEAPDTVRFTRAIKDHVPHEARADVIEALWSVVLADGRRDDEENAQMRLMASLLGVSDRDSALARQRATRSG
ncbi:MAG: hypothetical protein CVT80_16090 [Alphaproteobacteria bacterium HGW-Alphaproteobacteria-2]|nr:MAG: hypothetical protein CVT80_16090 [Alphaproteobacteria bacterium HGW-Alphaproteobacteria-2]